MLRLQRLAHACFSLGQGGMHVNGAPLMQASMPGGVPAPVQMTAAVAGPGPGSLAPAGNFQLESLLFCFFAEDL